MYDDNRFQIVIIYRSFIIYNNNFKGNYYCYAYCSKIAIDIFFIYIITFGLNMFFCPSTCTEN